MSMHAKQVSDTSRQQSSEAATASGAAKAANSVRNATDAQRIPAWAMNLGDGLPPGLVLQTNLTVNQPGDVYEQEADQVAEQVMRMADPKASVSDDEDEAKNSLMRKQSSQTGAHGATVTLSVPPIVHDVLNGGGGQPLDPTTRAFMEPRFGYDFSHVRVHANSDAAQSARELDARAYTVGSNIVFATRQYAPHTGPGLRLLTHELTHVVQQAQGLSDSNERLEYDAERAENGQVPSVNARGVPIARLHLSPDRATRLVILLTGGKTAQFTVKTDTGESLSEIGAATGIVPGEYRVSYNREIHKLEFKAKDGSDLALGGGFNIGFLPQGERMLRLLRAVTEAIPMEVRSGQAPGGTAEPSQTHEVGKAISLPQAVAELPERIRDVLFSRTDTSQLQPSDYPVLLRIAHKLLELSDLELQAYRARTFGTTTDLMIFETSVDRYIEEVRQRRRAVQERERTKRPLNGLGEVYRQYRQYKALLSASTSVALSGFGEQSGEALGRSISNLLTLNRLEEELTANLLRYDFNSIDEFAQAIRDFETAFRTETVLIARDMLDRYERVLYEQEQRWATHQQEASRVREQEQAMTPWKLRERREAVQKTRQNLASKPDLVFKLNALLQRAFLEQNIPPRSIYQDIIIDHIRDITIDEAIIKLAIGVFTLAAGLLSGGTGTVAVLGAVTSLGIGAYQTFEEFRQYEVMSAAHDAQLLSKEPSFAWVIVALAGAGLDVAGVISAMRVGGTLRSAIEAFNETPDLVKLGKQLEHVEERIRTNVLRAAEAEAQARAAWRSVFRPPASLRAVIVPGAEEFGRLVYAVYLSIRRGIIQGITDFDSFVLTRVAKDLIGDVARLTPEELISLKAAYRQAIADWEVIARQGQSLGMAENEVHAFMRMWNNRGGMTVEQVTKEMAAWQVTKQSGVPFGFRSAEHFEEFRTIAEAELRRVVKKADPNAKLFLQGSSVTGISYSRQVPFDVESDLDVAISSRYLFRQAGTKGFEVSASPSRIGPLSDKQIAVLGLKRLRDRLSKVVAEEAQGAAGAARQREINFLLFDNERAARTPIGSASKEAIRPTIPLGEEE